VSISPRLSILLPAWNAAATLGGALGSIRRQSEPDFECIVVDDGSDDATARIVTEVARRDARFRLISQPRGGLVAALNRGIGHCRGGLIARMDADDLMHRRRLERQAGALDADPSLSALGCRVRIFPRSQLSQGMRRYEAWLNGMATPDVVRREAFVECPIAHPTLMIRARLLRDLGYRARGWPEDYDLVLRLLAEGHRIGVVPERLHLWRDQPDRLSRRDPTYGLDRFTACKAAFLADGLLRNRPSYVLWGYGDTGRALRRALLTHGRAPSHVVELHPGRLGDQCGGRPGNRIHGAPVIRPEALLELRPRALVVSVAGAGPRAEIRAALAAMGFQEGRDFVCAA